MNKREELNEDEIFELSHLKAGSKACKIIDELQKENKILIGEQFKKDELIQTIKNVRLIRIKYYPHIFTI